MDWEEEHGRDVDALDVHDLELQKSNKISSISQKTSVFFFKYRMYGSDGECRGLLVGVV